MIHAASRQEIEKLALLAGPGGTLSYEDVVIALGDSGLLATTDIRHHTHANCNDRNAPR